MTIPRHWTIDWVFSFYLYLTYIDIIIYLHALEYYSKLTIIQYLMICEMKDSESKHHHKCLLVQLD